MTDGIPDAALSLPGFHVLVPVWGAAYCDLFTQISLPSQLAPGNLPALPHKDRCLYHVLTRPEDAPHIHGSEAWRRLRSLMPVRLELRDDQEPTSYETMSAYLRDGIALADDNDAASLFFNPDLVFADGTLGALVGCVQGGKRAVFATGVRLLQETVVPELMRFRSGENIISLPSRELTGIAMRNLHPLSRQNFWTEHGTFLPATIFWPVKDEGLLARCFHLHPLLVWPERKHVHFRGTVDDDFVPVACPHADTDHVVTDSDDLLVCEISPYSRFADFGYRKGSIDDVVDWAESHTDARHRRLATFSIHIHSTEMTERLWAAAETASAQVVDEVLRQLQTGSLSLFLRSPMRLFRRWVRRAATSSILHQNFKRESGWRARIAASYLAFYRHYSAFCASYERFRARLSDLLFGPSDAPYPWNGRWFTIHRQVRAALQLAPSRNDRTLIIAAAPDARRGLARAFEHAALMERSQHNVSAAGGDQRLPYGSGTFDLVVCADALQHTEEPQAFMAELARVLAPSGHAIIVGRNDPHGAKRCCSGLKAIEAAVPPTLVVQRSMELGGIGSTWALQLYRWSEYQRHAYRISPVILEVPILPLLVVGRLLAGGAVALGANIVDLFDRSGRSRTHTAVLLTRRDREPDSP